MKDLNLTRSIPLGAVGALMIVGCGGRTLGLTDEGAGDPLSDETFEDTLLESLEDLCQQQIACGYSYDYQTLEECASYAYDSLSEQFELDKRQCRSLAVKSVECLANVRRCGGYQACERTLEDFLEDCAVYDFNSYRYYEY